MFYSDDLIEEIRSRNDIVDVISSYVKLTKKGNTYFGLCPFHNEKSPSFSVTPSKQMYYCFGCGQGGNVFTFVMKYENMTFTDAVKFLADKAGVSLPEQEYSPEEKRKADIPALPSTGRCHETPCGCKGKRRRSKVSDSAQCRQR